MIVLVTYDDRDEEFVSMTREMNADLARKHGYVLESHHRFTAKVPPWWVKVFLTNEYVRRSAGGPDHWFVWLDSDAFLRDGPLTLRRFLLDVPEHTHFVGSYDFVWRPGSMNAGVFAVRGTQTGQAILDSWAGCYEPREWRLEAQQWHTDGAWAGTSFEQGAFNEVVMRQPALCAAIRLYANDFVSYDFDAAGCIKHFPVHLRAMVPAAHHLHNVDPANALCLRFGGEYHELSRLRGEETHVVSWPYRFPLSTATKQKKGGGDLGRWTWRHDGVNENGWIELRDDGTVVSSWFGKDGWWSRRQQADLPNGQAGKTIGDGTTLVYRNKGVLNG